jgi:murein DD-endopeptidase MepM/ murein hydrolase activator NlpD
MILLKNFKLKLLYNVFFIVIILFVQIFPEVIFSKVKPKKRYIPKPVIKKFVTSDYKLFIYARKIQQGEGIYFKIFPKTKMKRKPNLFFLKYKVPLLKKKYKNITFYDGLAGIAPWQKASKTKIKIHYFRKGKKGKKTIKKYYTHNIKIKKTKFQKRWIKLKISKKYTAPKKKNYKLINKLWKIKQKAFNVYSPRKWSKRFIDPRNLAKITSQFYSRRIYNTKPGSPHSGVDLKGKNGAPIRAMNSGKVLVARKFYYEGNFTIIDHGEGIFSYYMHQSKLLVKKGQMVKRGQLIGLVGSTGMVTGPHLHLSVRINRTVLSPLSFLSLPISK